MSCCSDFISRNLVVYSSRPKGAPSTFMPCSEAGISWSLLHSCCHRQLVDSTVLLTTAIPDLGPATMDVDVGVHLQLLADNLVHRCHTVGSTHQIDVVQESENFLGTQHPVRDRLQALVQTQAEEQRHEWVALLAAFSLGDVVYDPSIILPQTRRRAAVELTDKRPQPVTAFHCHQPRNHDVPRDEVEGSHAIH